MAKTSGKQIEIPAIDIQYMRLTLTGTSPLIVHAWSDKAKRQILDKQMKVAKTRARETRNPVEDFINSLYWLTPKPAQYTEQAFHQALEQGARFGFPAVAFKSAAVSAGYRSGVTQNKTVPNSAFHINVDMVEVKGTPEMREDMVRIGMGVADIRYRGEFRQWEVELPLRYNAAVFSDGQIVNLFNLGGFACGIGEWRPERGGSYGMYEVKQQPLNAE